jgi:sec-independent protein translocase protein TatB
MFDIAWSELALIGAVALIVIGPKDLPKVMRSLGQWTRKARLLASEFQHNVEDMIREAELDEIRRKVQSVDPSAVKEKMDEILDTQAMEEAMKIDPSTVPVDQPAGSPASPSPGETAERAVEPAEVADSAAEHPVEQKP